MPGACSLNGRHRLGALFPGVAGVEGLNQRDGIHPTAEGARIVADRVWAVLEPVVREAAKGPATR